MCLLTIQCFADTSHLSSRVSWLQTSDHHGILLVVLTCICIHAPCAQCLLACRNYPEPSQEPLGTQHLCPKPPRSCDAQLDQQSQQAKFPYKDWFLFAGLPRSRVPKIGRCDLPWLSLPQRMPQWKSLTPFDIQVISKASATQRRCGSSSVATAKSMDRRDP